MIGLGLAGAPKWWVKLEEEVFLCPNDRARFSKIIVVTFATTGIQ